jgi:hypothetical protein
MEPESFFPQRIQDLEQAGMQKYEKNNNNHRIITINNDNILQVNPDPAT